MLSVKKPFEGADMPLSPFFASFALRTLDAFGLLVFPCLPCRTNRSDRSLRAGGPR